MVRLKEFLFGLNSIQACINSQRRKIYELWIEKDFDCKIKRH